MSGPVPMENRESPFEPEITASRLYTLVTKVSEARSDAAKLFTEADDICRLLDGAAGYLDKAAEQLAQVERES